MTETEVDIQGINGDADSAAMGIAHGTELMHFATAIAQRDESAMPAARRALLASAGPAVVIDAAGVAANFQRMVRIADSIGIPIDDMSMEVGVQVRAELGLERFASAQNTLQPA